MIRRRLRFLISSFRWYFSKDFLKNPSIMPPGFVLARGARIYPRNNVHFGANVYVGDWSQISTSDDPEARIVIGADTMVADHVLIVAGNHAFSNRDVPMRLQGKGSQRPVLIEEDCWIGCGSILVGGSRLPRGSILAAGSVAVKPFEQTYSLYAGNPSKWIKVCRE